MEYIRNEKLGLTEVYKNDRLLGTAFSIEDLWKKKVYVVYSNEYRVSRVNNKKQHAS